MSNRKGCTSTNEFTQGDGSFADVAKLSKFHVLNASSSQKHNPRPSKFVDAVDSQKSLKTIKKFTNADILNEITDKTNKAAEQKYQKNKRLLELGS